MTPPALIELEDVSKRFTLHHRDGAELQVLHGVNLRVAPGECVVLEGPSGMGKSTLLKLIHANYRASGGRITVRDADGRATDVTTAGSRELVRMRQRTVGYVSQFLRAVPRISALDVVAEPLLEGADAGDPNVLAAARATAGDWLALLRIPERLWHLPPATFSGGEQQRVNIARSLILPRPVLLLDEPTASLDAANTDTVVALIHEAAARGAALVGIFHDDRVGAAVATRRIDMAQFRGQP
ncbi:phosphonate C-P lyase system protein PhnL [Acidovorax sp. NCPPB 2350]|nr:phosphonate C-P lyase system protein PhnL [Acidovorax sp. NCPPB 2350]